MTTYSTVLKDWSDEATATWLVLVDDAIKSEDQAQVDRLAAAWEAAMNERYPARGSEIPIVSAREYGIIAGIALEHLDPDADPAHLDPDEPLGSSDLEDPGMLAEEDAEAPLYDPDEDGPSPAESGWPEDEPETEDPNGVIFGSDLDRWPETGFGD